MARTRVRWGRVGGLVASAGVGVMLAAGAAHAGGAAERGHRAPSPHARYYVVRPGDTLWAIAARATSPNADLRPVVDRLVAVNRLDGSLVPGQRIAVPR